MRPTRFVPLFLGLGVLVGLAGCSGSGGKGEVAGTVKFHGQAPKFHGLQVVFLGEDGTLASAAVNEDGTYKAANVPAGEVKVCFGYVPPDAAKMGAEFQTGGRKLAKPGEARGPAPKAKLTGSEPTTNPVPPPLCEHATSKLTVKVEAGKTAAFDYDIP